MSDLDGEVIREAKEVEGNTQDEVANGPNECGENPGSEGKICNNKGVVEGALGVAKPTDYCYLEAEWLGEKAMSDYASALDKLGHPTPTSPWVPSYIIPKSPKKMSS